MSRSRKHQHNARKSIFVDIIVLIVVAVIFAVTMPFAEAIELELGLAYYVDENGERVDTSVAEAEEGASGELKVHFVNVRQGDCIILELPDGKNMIIDGANTKSYHREAVLSFIEKTLPDLEFFDYAILTHADADHCGSLDDVLNLYPAYTVYRPNVLCSRDGYTDPGKDDLLDYYGASATAAYKNFLDAAYTPTAAHDFTPKVIVTDATDDSQTITGGAGDDKYSLTFYSPLYASEKKYSDANDYSSIMLFEYRDFKFVLTGDAEEKNEREFVAKVESAKTDGVTDKYDVFTDAFNADVIKAGHHGSDTSNSRAFLDTVTTPDGAKSTYYVFSCDATDNNNYGHPKQEVLDRLADMNVPDDKILRTDRVGDISFSVRAADDGEYKLFYGDVASVKPDDPNTPDDTNKDDGKKDRYTLVHVTIGSVELRWTWLAWVAYAVIFVAVMLHLVFALKFDGRKK